MKYRTDNNVLITRFSLMNILCNLVNGNENEKEKKQAESEAKGERVKETDIR